MAQIVRGGWITAQFVPASAGDFETPLLTLERLYNQVEVEVTDEEQDMADGTIAQAGVRVSGSIRDLDLDPSVYEPIKTAAQQITKMNIKLNSLKSGEAVILYNCSVRYGIEIGAAGDFNRSRINFTGFAHDIDDLLEIVQPAP